MPSPSSERHSCRPPILPHPQLRRPPGSCGRLPRRISPCPNARPAPFPTRYSDSFKGGYDLVIVIERVDPWTTMRRSADPPTTPRLFAPFFDVEATGTTRPALHAVPHRHADPWIFPRFCTHHPHGTFTSRAAAERPPRARETHHPTSGPAPPCSPNGSPSSDHARRTAARSPPATRPASPGSDTLPPDAAP